MAEDPFKTGELEALSKFCENDAMRKCFCGKPAWKDSRDCEMHTKFFESLKAKRVKKNGVG